MNIDNRAFIPLKPLGNVLNIKKRLEISDPKTLVESSTKKFCISLSQPTISDLIKLIQINNLTKSFIQELEKFENFKDFLGRLKSSACNALDPEKFLLTLCLEEIFRGKNSYTSNRVKDFFNLLCWSHIYEFGKLPSGNDQDLLKFLECENFFDLIKNFSAINLKGGWFGSELKLEKLSQLISNQFEYDSPFKALMGAVIKNFQFIFIKNSTFPSTNILCNFFEEKVTLKQCEKWIEHIFDNNEDKVFSRNLALYIKILSNSQSKLSKTLPDFSLIRNEVIRPLVENIECHVRGLEIKISENFFEKNFLELPEVNDSSQEFDFESSLETSTKIIRLFPATIDSLLELIDLHGLTDPFLEEIKVSKKFNKNYEVLTAPKMIMPPNKLQLLKIFLDSIFGLNSEKSVECRLLIDFFCWNHLYENGHLPGNDNAQLLKFLGVNNFYELISPPPDSSKLKKKSVHPYTNLEVLKKFMDGFENSQNPAVKKLVGNNPLTKQFLKKIFNSRFIKQFNYDEKASCETIIYEFFQRRIPIFECNSLVEYMFDSSGDSWLGRRPQYLALYLKILSSNSATQILPKELPDISKIENKEAQILIEKIESYLRLEEKDFIENENVDENKVLWKPFPQLEDSKTEEEIN